MPTQHVTRERSAYNVLFAALGKAGCIDEALACFRRMEDEAGLAPGAYEYGTLIAACGGALDRRQGQGEGEGEEAEAEVARLVGMARGLLGEAERATMLLRGGGGDGGMGNCYVQMLKVYGKAGRWGQARALLGALLCSWGLGDHLSHSHGAMSLSFFHRHNAPIPTPNQTEPNDRRDAMRGGGPVLCALLRGHALCGVCGTEGGGAGVAGGGGRGGARGQGEK